MSQDNKPDEKPEVPKAEMPKPVGFIKVVVSVCIPRPDYPQVSAQANCEPLIFNIFAQTKNQKELPDGVLKTTRTVLAEMVELIRNFQHEPLTTEQRAQLSNIHMPPKPQGRPHAQVYARNPETGETRAVGKPVFLDAQGNELHNEKP